MTQREATVWTTNKDAFGVARLQSGLEALNVVVAKWTVCFDVVARFLAIEFLVALWSLPINVGEADLIFAQTSHFAYVADGRVVPPIAFGAGGRPKSGKYMLANPVQRLVARSQAQPLVDDLEGERLRALHCRRLGLK